MKKAPQVAILNNSMSGWGQQLISGILSYANEVGPWEIWMNPQSPRIFDELPQDWTGDGVIARVMSQSLAQELNERGLPVVNVADVDLPGFSAPTIRTDDRAGAQQALEHFVDRGIRSFAFAGTWFLPSQKRYSELFQEACEAQGFSCSVFEVKDRSREHLLNLVEWIQSLPKPLGILVLGNESARNVVNCCRHAGITVPHDVAVLCCGYDELLSYACFPTLSGLRTPTKQIGYQAASTLHRMLQGETVAPDTMYIPPRGVVERLSTETLAVNDSRMEEILEYINEHAYEPFTTLDIMKEVPMSRRSMERLFHNTLGRTIFDEVRRIRINKARHLLAESDLDMSSIAEACGYSSYNILSNTFKKVTQMSPSEYRKLNRVK